MRAAWSALGCVMAVGGVLAAWSSCAIEGFELVDAPPSGGGAFAGGGAGATGSGGMGGMVCGSKTWPSAPSSPGTVGGDLDLVWALRSLDFGESDLLEGPKVGFDLDGRCSCADDGPTCTTPEPGKQSCDGPAGVDNAIAELFAAAAAFQDNFTSAYHTQRAEDGSWTLLVRIQDYNGEPNDGQVRLAIYPSGGLDEDPCHVAGEAPSWDGSDAWPVLALSLEEPAGMGGAGGAGGPPACGDPPPAGYSLDEPKYLDQAGYVTGGVLVASLPEVGIALSVDGLAIELTGGFLTGTLSEQGGAWLLTNATLAGRWALAAVFQAMSSLGSDSSPLCTDDSAYELIRDAVCAKRDITSTIAGPTAPCDAVSFGMSFEAEPAQLGIIYEGQPGSSGGCSADTDPTNDSCPEN